MIYDITQPLFECAVFPGDTPPEKTVVRSMDRGDPYQLTDIRLCVHNGTHVDAPAHFIRGGETVDRIGPGRFIGPAYVASHEGGLTAPDAEAILTRACGAGAGKKILIRGSAVVTADAARVFAAAGPDLIGCESQSFGPEDSPEEVHVILLGAGVILLEGIRLDGVPDGKYLLNCAPLNLSGTEGAPCRAVLMTDGI